MKRLLPYFKKYWRYILAAFALLIVMTNADLLLPDYMSRIVNVGIQQNGIESPVPNVMRQSTMETLRPTMPSCFPRTGWQIRLTLLIQ
jgi:ATP-binding cassette subfamily B multidrug efflux pump